VSGTNADPSDVGLVTIDMLPDDVLVEIFFYVNIFYVNIVPVKNPWLALVHVCRRWRYLVLESPRHLNLRLEYHGHGSISEVLGGWPVLPIILKDQLGKLDQRWDNVVAALQSEHYSRICGIDFFNITKLRWERFAAAMQKPFPELTYLDVSTYSVVPVLPDSFLGGSAPRLRELSLECIPFPSIPKLLLSSNGLVRLSLWNIPVSGYFSPDAIATALTVMTRLEFLRLRFFSPRPRPDPESRLLHPFTRFVLPALTRLMFKGVYEYLEDLLTRIDAPLLDYLDITFFMDLDFDVPQLYRLIDHAEAFNAFDQAQVLILNRAIQLNLYSRTGKVDHRTQLKLQINCEKLDYQLSSLAQVCSSSFPRVSAMENLYIRKDDDRLVPPPLAVDMETGQWLAILDPFTALKNLDLWQEIAAHVCSALQELSGERVTEVLPTLQGLFITHLSSDSLPEGLRKAIKTFVAARRRSGHPVSVHRTDPLRRGSMDITEELVSGD